MALPCSFLIQGPGDFMDRPATRLNGGITSLLSLDKDNSTSLPSVLAGAATGASFLRISLLFFPTRFLAKFGMPGMACSLKLKCVY